MFTKIITNCATVIQKYQTELKLNNVISDENLEFCFYVKIQEFPERLHCSDLNDVSIILNSENARRAGFFPPSNGFTARRAATIWYTAKSN